MGDNKVNYCAWCGSKTMMEPMQLPSTPILEFLEDKIDKLGRQRVWGENSNWALMDMDPDDEAKLLVYDEMLSNVSLKHVCERCISEDERLYKKYYGGDDVIRFDAEF